MNRAYLRSAKDDGFVYAIPEDMLKRLNVHDTYDRHGMIVSYTDAEDYSIYNVYVDLMDKLKKNIVEMFGIDILEFDIDEDGLVYTGEEDLDMDTEQEINEYIEKFERDNSTYTKCVGFNYFDGTKWSTVLIEDDRDFEDYVRIESEDAIKEYDEVLENMTQVKESNAIKYYEWKDLVVEESLWQGSWEEYKIYNKQDNN